jgi:excinuclease UvrABC nuclease subunit
MQRSATAQEYERAGKLRDQLSALEWLVNSLIRLRKTRQELSFIYPVTSLNGDIWYVIHEGQVRGVISRPVDEQGREQTRTLLEEVYDKPPKTGIPLEVIDHVWLVAAWFRKYPNERNRCLNPSDVTRAISCAAG